MPKNRVGSRVFGLVRKTKQDHSPAPQAQVILTTLEGLGGQASQDDIVDNLRRYGLKTKQSPRRIFDFYRKELIKEGYIKLIRRHAKGNVSASKSSTSNKKASVEVIDAPNDMDMNDQKSAFSASVRISSRKSSGPLPSPEELEALEKIKRGITNRLLVVFEKEQSERHKKTEREQKNERYELGTDRMKVLGGIVGSNLPIGLLVIGAIYKDEFIIGGGSLLGYIVVVALLRFLVGRGK